MMTDVIKFFRDNRVHSNRSERELFSVCLYNLSMRFPRIIDDETFMYEEVSSCLVTFAKEERNHILKSLLIYCKDLK